ncbi:MAG: ATP-binding cassette domain-containing protein [Lachnospiraceae bacterium]
MNENHEVILKVEHLKQYFGKEDFKAVDDVSFDIKRGEVFGVVGESGCGKTTTGRSIIKLYNCTSGNVYFKGQRICAGLRSYEDTIKEAKAATKKTIEKLKAGGGNAQGIEEEKSKLAKVIGEQKKELEAAKRDHKNCNKLYIEKRIKERTDEYERDCLKTKNKEELSRNYHEDIARIKKENLVTEIQMIFQDPIASLNPRMTVREIIAEGLRIQGVKDEAYIDEQVFEMLELVGLVREHADRYPHEFSGGQRQRIGIARAVIMHPELIIADEPISALDVSIQAQVINLLNDLKEKMGLTIMFIAHDLSVVKYFSDRIAVMYYGKIVELAESNELFKHPLHPYTKSLLSAIPVPDPHFEKKRKRVKYNPTLAHDYATQGPIMREILPGHFISCNDVEYEQYKKEVKND